MSDVVPSPSGDAWLRERLQALEPVEVSPDFTDRALQRFGRARARRRTARRAAAVAALVVFALAGWLTVDRWGDRDRTASARVAALEAEVEDLRRQLDALSRRAEVVRPVVHLGGDERHEFYVDLERLAAALAQQTAEEQPPSDPTAPSTAGASEPFDSRSDGPTRPVI
ncbi:MAG: hypothetical protein AAGN46_16450 [Acidobacteriota bacterium]